MRTAATEDARRATRRVPRHQTGEAQKQPIYQEAAFRLDSGSYLYIQTYDLGYDYTLYGSDFELLDGGQLDNPSLSMTAARDEIIAMQELQHMGCSVIPAEEFEEKREAAERRAHP